MGTPGVLQMVEPQMVRLTRGPLFAVGLAVAITLSGCTGGTPTRHHASPSSLTRVTPNTHRQPTIRARIVLPANTIRSGSAIRGKVIVLNRTGHTIHGIDCITPFAVALENRHYKPKLAWAACAQKFTVPMGRSVWRIELRATYQRCDPHKHPHWCANSHMPSLPPGRYKAKLFQNPHVVPAPRPVRVRVTK